MDTVDLIIKSSTEFYNDLRSDENGRYRSWEHCYSHFMNARGRNDVDYDYLSLQLAFYLASWGMYRGSSFLLQKDYRVHIPVVKELLSEKYDALAGIDCIGLGSDFDGIPQNLEIKDASYMPMLYQALQNAGFHEDDIEKIFYKNVLRVYKNVLL